MRRIKYISCFKDFSGYSEACRGYALALYERGVPLTLKCRNFDQNPPEVAKPEHQEILDALTDRPMPYNTVLIHLTPDLYKAYVEPGAYNIGFVAWETTKLHPTWVDACNLMDEIWVPSQFNVRAFEQSGVTVPITKIPHGIDIEVFTAPDEEFSIDGVSSSTFKFYSIFQWNDRKNPEGLLRSYFNAFDGEDDVVLILKTYVSSYNPGPGAKRIRDEIMYIKKDMGFTSYPKVILINSPLSKRQMVGLHKYGDACVSLHRGEGWGLVPFEAGLAGNPVIATGATGNMEFMSEDNSFLVDFRWSYVADMATFNCWYKGDQRWADPDLIHASKLMRHVFEDLNGAKVKARKLQNEIISNYSWGAVADTIINRLKEIH